LLVFLVLTLASRSGKENQARALVQTRLLVAEAMQIE